MSKPIPFDADGEVIDVGQPKPRKRRWRWLLVIAIVILLLIASLTSLLRTGRVVWT